MLSGGGLYTLFFGLTRIPPKFKIKIMYNSSIMTIQEWAGLVLTLLSISIIILGGIRWYISVQIRPIAEAVEDIRKETKTNGGTSMRDEIKQIKLEQESAREKRKATSDKLDHMYDILLEYVSKNSK
jgi:hypothetical protein